VDDKLKAAIAGFNLSLMAYLLIRWLMGMPLTWSAFTFNLLIGAVIGAVVGGIAYFVMAKA
jgi:hypothetical protein